MEHSCSCYCERQSKVVLLMCLSCAGSYAKSTSDCGLLRTRRAVTVKTWLQRFVIWTFCTQDCNYSHSAKLITNGHSVQDFEFFIFSVIKWQNTSDGTRAAADHHCWLFPQFIDCCLVYEMSENGEKCRSVFPKAQGDVLKCLVLSTIQIFSLLS